jgi:hypothetical protein
MTPTLLCVTYKLRIPAENFRVAAQAAAQQIAAAPGLVWKLWGLDADTGEGTSFYLFRDAALAKAFASGQAIAALRSGPAETVTTRVAPVELPLSAITAAALASDLTPMEARRP